MNRIIFSFIFLVNILVPFSLAQGETNISYPRFNDSEFYQLVDRESKNRVEQLKSLLSQEELTGLKKVRKLTIDFIKKQNPVHHMKELLISHGVGVALTSIASEFVTIVIMPPILISSGLPVLAGIIGGLPSPLYSVPAFLALKSKLEKRRLIKKLELDNFKKLEKLRHSLLGFSKDNRLLSVTLEFLEERPEISIIKRKFERFRGPLEGSAISLHELEKLAKNHLGQRELKLVKELSHKDDTLLTTLLLNLIGERPEACDELSQLIKGKYRGSAMTPPSKVQTELLRIDEKLKLMGKMKIQARKEKTQLLKHAKDLNLSKGNIKEIKTYFDHIVLDLEILEFDIKKYEYTFLGLMLDGTEVNEHFLERPIMDVLSRYRLLSMKLAKAKMPDFPHNYSKKQKFFKLIEELAESNKLYLPQTSHDLSKAGCYDLMSEFLLPTAI